MLNTAEPTIVPTPMSPSVMNVPMAFTNNSGADVAAAINVAPATSFDIESAKMQHVNFDSFTLNSYFLYIYVYTYTRTEHKNMLPSGVNISFLCNFVEKMDTEKIIERDLKY